MVRDNIIFTFSSPDKSLVEYMQDKFFSGNNNLDGYSVKENEIKEINHKYVLRIFMEPSQMEMDLSDEVGV